MAFSVEFKTEAVISNGSRDLRPHEIYALLDWCFGELNAIQTREYALVSKYPESLDEISAARKS